MLLFQRASFQTNQGERTRLVPKADPSAHMYIPSSPALLTLVLHHHYKKDRTESRNVHLEDHQTPALQETRHNPTRKRLTVSGGRYHWQSHVVEEKRRELSDQTGGSGNRCESRQTSAQEVVSEAGPTAEAKLKLLRNIWNDTWRMTVQSWRSHRQHEERLRKCILSGYVRAIIWIISVSWFRGSIPHNSSLRCSAFFPFICSTFWVVFQSVI